MDKPGWVDLRRSALVNAGLLVVVALIPILGAANTADIDTREARPWGCRTCSVPVAPVPDASLEDSL